MRHAAGWIDGAVCRQPAQCRAVGHGIAEGIVDRSGQDDGRPITGLRLRQLRNGGQSARYVHSLVGVNSRLDELQAAILGVRLDHLDCDNARRRAIAACYDAALAGSTRLIAPWTAPDVEPVHHLYVLRTVDRTGLKARLAAQGIASDCLLYTSRCV